jgi:hypothetical protein
MTRRLPFDPIAQARRLWAEHGWAEAAPGMAAVTSLMRAQQIVAARVDEALKPFGLSFARYEVLMLLLFSRRGSLPMARIGERLQVHPASVTNAVDRLEAQGLVRRSPHPTDRRGDRRAQRHGVRRARPRAGRRRAPGRAPHPDARRRRRLLISSPSVGRRERRSRIVVIP